MEYRIFFNLLVLAAIAGFVLLRKMRFIEAILFLTPFRAIALNLGLSFTVSEVITILGIGVFLIVRGKREIVFSKAILPYLVYCVISTVLLSVLFVDAIPVKQGNIMREEGRFLVQIILNILPVYGLLFLIVNYVKTYDQVIRGLRAFLSGITVLVALGLLQFLVFKVANIDLFPLGSYTGNTRTSVFDVVAGLSGWIRICSLGGEPKGLAAIAAVGLGTLLVLGKFLPNTVKRYSIKAWVFALTLILTLSTGGILLGALLTMLAFLFRITLSRINWNWTRLSVFLPATGILIISLRYFAYIEEVFQSRIINRIYGVDSATAGGVEDFDQTILAFLKDQPEWAIFGTGWGNVHNLAQQYIPSEFAYYMQDTIFVAKSGYLKVVSESGGVGLLLLIGFEAFILLSLYKKFHIHPVYKLFFSLCVIGFAAYMIRSNYVVYEFIILHGLAISTLYADLNEPEYVKINS